MRTSDRPRLSPGVPGDDFDASLLRRTIVVLVGLKLAGIILIFDPTGLDAFHLAKSVYSRGTAWVLAALVALALFRFGGAILPRTRLHLFVLAFVAANIASAFVAENAYVAMFGEREKYLGLTFLADMLVLYAAVAVSFRRKSDWAVLAVSIALAGLVSVGYAGLQSVGLDPVTWDLGSNRPFGTFGNPDMLGHFLSLVFGGAVGIAAFSSGRLGPLTRVAAAFAAGLALVAALATATRGSLLGIGAALGVALLLSLRLRGVSWATIQRVTIRGLVALTVLTGVLALSPFLAERIRATTQGIQVSSRVLIYETALRALADRPILGYGPDNFAVAYPRYRQPNSVTVRDSGPENSAHGWPFQTAATLGLVGLVIFLLLLAAAMRSLWTRGLMRAPAVAVPVLLASAAYWAHGLVAVDAISVDWWPWVAFGAAAALCRDPLATARPVRRVLPAAAFAVLGLAVILAASGLTALRSNQDALAARFAWQDGRADAAFGAAVSAVRQDAGRADRWNWLGLAIDLHQRWAEAAEAYREATVRAPHEAAYWSNLARSRARQALSGDDSGGGSAAALDAARRAVAVDPNAPEPNAVLVEIANLFGDHELALDAAIRAIHLYPAEPSYDFIAAEAVVDVADQAAARRKLEEVLALRDSATLRVATARLALTLNDREGARLHARRALELEPQNREALSILSEAGG